jgi:hypothetical protein
MTQHTGSTKKLLLLSSMPANAFHQAMNAVINPRIPPAFMHLAWGTPSVCCKCPIASRRKVKSRKKKSAEKARVDFRVHMKHMKVKMNQLCTDTRVSHLLRNRSTWLLNVRNEKEAEGIVQFMSVILVSFYDAETTGLNDGKGDPESAVG